MKNNELFTSATHGEVHREKTILLIKEFLEQDPKAQYSLVIGSDSQEKKDTKGKSISLVTAIIVHRKGFGGKYFWKKRIVTNINSLRQKIYTETMESLEFATSFVPQMREALNGKSVQYDLEIHVDVGRYGDTRDMIKEVVGMVNGNGFVAKTKPESFGATYIADKHT